MTDWNNPLLTSTYVDVLDLLKDRDEDSVTLFVAAGTNIPTGSIRYNRATFMFQEWDGAAWDDVVLAVAGGGTGSSTAAGARTNLGLGTMAVQNAVSVAITGGTIVDITSLDMKGDITMDADAAYNLASNANRVKKGYFRTALVIPTGADMFATS